MKITGFTLIEVVIYLALFSLLMTGILQTVYIVFETTTVSEDKIFVLADGNFLNQKLTWLFTGATAVDVISTSSVSILRPDLGSSSLLTLSSSGGAWYLQRGTSSPQTLINDHIFVSDTIITVTPETSGKASVLLISYKLANTPFTYKTLLPYE